MSGIDVAGGVLQSSLEMYVQKDRAGSLDQSISLTTCSKDAGLAIYAAC